MSLRLRLLLATGAIALIALLAADVATYSALRSSLYGKIDQDLQAAMAGVGGGPGGPPGSGGTFVELREPSQAPLIRSYGSEPGGRSYTPELPANLTAPAGSGGSYPARYFTTSSTVAGGPHFRVAVAGTPNGGVRVVALPLDPTTATLHQLRLIEAAVTAAALVAALLLGWWLVRVSLRPLVRIEATAGAIADGALEARVPDDDPRTEVGRLARALNVMLARIERAFAERDATEAQLRASEDRLRRFVSDASHELRTPLAAVSAYAELFSRGAQERPADLSRVMSGIRAESARMARMVEDLLLLARLDEARAAHAKVDDGRPVELVDLAGEAVQAAVTVGPQWPVTLEATSTVEVPGDRGRLRQVVDNLLANVRAHTPPGTATTVRIGRAGGEASIEVADRGPGLSEEQATHVFDRFYRADPSRSRDTGGAGLGLSIVVAIVDAHGGSVKVAPGPAGGATFTVRLPEYHEENDVVG